MANPNWKKGCIPYNKQSINCICFNCTKKFEESPSRIKNGRGKFCSKECFDKFRKGKKNPIMGLWNKGKPSWNKGMKGFLAGEKSPHWKGNKASYIAIHTWIRDTWGKASSCENSECIFLNPKRFEWANISGKYLRVKEDWIMLCPSCHRIRDNKNPGQKRNFIEKVR